MFDRLSASCNPGREMFSKAAAVAVVFVMVASTAATAGADMSPQKGSTLDSPSPAGLPDSTDMHIFGHEPRVDTCYKERYVANRTTVGADAQGGTGSNRYYPETDPDLRFFSAHWIYDWEFVESTQSWTGSWRYLEDSLDTKDGQILTGWIWHSNYTSPGSYTTRPVEYGLAERQQCGSYLPWQKHRYDLDDRSQVGCLLFGADVVLGIGAAVFSLGLTAPIVATALLAGTVCLAAPINNIFATPPSSKIIYEHDKDRWIIETGTPSRLVYIPDGASTIQVNRVL